MKSILLDIDGTLVDSNDAHAKAWIEALAEAGISEPYDRIRRAIGMGGDHLLPQVVGVDPDSARGKSISQRRGEIFRARYLPGLEPFAGAVELLEAFKARGLGLVVATSASAEDSAAILKLGGLDQLVDVVTHAGDAERSKPDPDIVRAALEKGGVAAGDAVMLGDTPYDVKAARGAGVEIWGFTCGGWSEEDLVGASRVFRGPEELLARLDREVR